LARQFEASSGRVGRGVYFFEGAQDAIEAARTIAYQKFSHGEEQYSGVTVLESVIRVRSVLDLDSPENYKFVARMMRAVNKYIRTCRPRELEKIHPHYVGYAVRECLGRVPKLDTFDAIRTHFSFDLFSDEGNVQKGIVIFNPDHIVKTSIVAGLATC
jgi:hypothetical protein